MERRDLSQKYRLKSEAGVALFTVMMGLILISSLALFVWQNAMLEIQISRYVQKEVTQTALLDSGIDLVLAWYSNPADSPNEMFFSGRTCNPEFKISQYWVKDIGKKLSFRFYKTGENGSGDCAAEVTSDSGKRVEVRLTPNPMSPMTEAVYGWEDRNGDLLNIVHGGGLPDPKGVHVLPIHLDRDKMKRFAKRFGRYLTITSTGNLRENGVEIGSFDQVFANVDKEGVVFVDTEGQKITLKIGKMPYTGYFYFTGDIEVEGGGMGRSVIVSSAQRLDNIDLNGFFYTPGKIILNDRFSVYGALYAESGFEGARTNHLQLWYNQDYGAGHFKGMLPLIPLIGTYKIM
jgi:hypothetical protein